MLCIECKNSDDYTCTTLSLILGTEISSASGLAFNQDPHTGKTYILTAEHFCKIVNDDIELPEYLKNDPSINSENISHSVNLILKDIEGNKYNAYILAVEENADLCLIASDELPIIKKVKIANSMPDRGDKIYVTSAPHGIHDYMSSIKFEGVYSGCSTPYTCLFSIPTDYGSSGSIILNENGEMIGMIQRISYNFNSVSMGAGVDLIREFLLLAEADLNLNIVP